MYNRVPEKGTKVTIFWNAYKMERPSIRVKLTITSKDDSRFLEPRTFETIPDVSFVTGLTDRGIRAAYHSKQESMRKRSGEVYNLKWEKPDPIRVEYVRNPAKKCAKCSKDLTPEDRSAWFLMYRGNDYERPLQFVSIYQASKETGISICALRYASKKANMMITRRSGGFVEKFEVYWASTCFDPCPKTKKELLRELDQ